MLAQAGNLVDRRRDEVVADEDVLVLFLDELVAGRHDDFDDVVAGRQHRRAGGGAVDERGRRGAAAIAVRVGLVDVGHAGGAVGAGRTAGARVKARHAREHVHAVVRGRLQLVPGMHAVVALELRVVGRLGDRTRRAVQHVAVEIDPLRLVLDAVEEQVGGRLARAAHVGNVAAFGIGRLHQVAAGVGAVALRPIVPARGRRVIDKRELRRHAIGRQRFLYRLTVTCGTSGSHWFCSSSAGLS